MEGLEEFTRILVVACTYFNGVPFRCESHVLIIPIQRASIQAQACEMQARRIAHSVAVELGPMWQWSRGRCYYS